MVHATHRCAHRSLVTQVPSAAGRRGSHTVGWHQSQPSSHPPGKRIQPARARRASRTAMSRCPAHVPRRRVRLLLTTRDYRRSPSRAVPVTRLAPHRAASGCAPRRPPPRPRPASAAPASHPPPARAASARRPATRMRRAASKVRPASARQASWLQPQRRPGYAAHRARSPHRTRTARPAVPRSPRRPGPCWLATARVAAPRAAP
mmetsp:Transcript_85680/g.256649  ORF Transcript_85680/g.256649 Transcript_85680/m.256649 type:complete len:205 (-) Transcript_85680:3153-3767(-)